MLTVAAAGLGGALLCVVGGVLLAGQVGARHLAQAEDTLARSAEAYVEALMADPDLTVLRGESGPSPALVEAFGAVDEADGPDRIAPAERYYAALQAASREGRTTNLARVRRSRQRWLDARASRDAVMDSQVGRIAVRLGWVTSPR